MKSSTKEKSSENKELKKFISRHSKAFTDWEILHRASHENYEEVSLDCLLDLIARDKQWYTTFLNNIRIKLK